MRHDQTGIALVADRGACEHAVLSLHLHPATDRHGMLGIDREKRALLNVRHKFLQFAQN